MTPERFAKLQRALDRRQPDLTVFMDSVNKPHNFSAIIRTADAVGIQRLHTISEADTLRRYHMIAGGTKHWVGVTLHRSTRAAASALRAEGWRLVAAHVGERTRDYREVDYTKKVAIMVGAELIGLSDAAQAAADDHVAIPMHGLGTSLNVSVAVGVILLEAERQRAAVVQRQAYALWVRRSSAAGFPIAGPEMIIGVTHERLLVWRPALLRSRPRRFAGAMSLGQIHSAGVHRKVFASVLTLLLDGGKLVGVETFRSARLRRFAAAIPSYTENKAR